MTNELTLHDDFGNLQRMALALYKSGYFKDAQNEAQAIVKVMAGAELGLPPFASMTNIHIISGKPVLGANLIATLIKNDARYDYRVTEHTDDTCTIAFYEGGQQVGVSCFSKQDAQQAGLGNNPNWKKYPRNMLFARAISNGARWYTPGIFGGAAVYTPDELGVETDEDGHVVIDGEYTTEETPRPVKPNPDTRTDAEIEAEIKADLLGANEPPPPADWRAKLEANQRPTVASIASILALAFPQRWANAAHAANSIIKRYPDFEGSGARVDPADALTIFDAAPDFGEGEEE